MDLTSIRQKVISSSVTNILSYSYMFWFVAAICLVSVPTYPAFLTVLGGMGLMMGGIFTGFSMKYRYICICNR